MTVAAWEGFDIQGLWSGHCCGLLSQSTLYSGGKKHQHHLLVVSQSATATLKKVQAIFPFFILTSSLLSLFSVLPDSEVDVYSVLMWYSFTKKNCLDESC